MSVDFDSKALEASRAIVMAQLQTLNETQWQARVQTIVLDCMKWAANQVSPATALRPTSEQPRETMTMTVLEATNRKHVAEDAILKAIRQFAADTKLEVRGVELERVSTVGRRGSEVEIVTMDVRFE